MDENEFGAGGHYEPPRRSGSPIIRYALALAFALGIVAILVFVFMALILPSSAPPTEQALQETRVALQVTQDALQTEIIAPSKSQTPPPNPSQEPTVFDEPAQKMPDALDAAGTRATQAEQTLAGAETRAVETRQAEAVEQTRRAIDESETRAAEAQQTIDALTEQQTRIAIAEETAAALQSLQTRAAKTQQALDALYAEQTRQAIEAFYAEQTRVAIEAFYTEKTRVAVEAFYAEQTRQAMQAFYAEQTRVAADKTRAAQNTNRVRYWIECDPDGNARLYVYTDGYEWPYPPNGGEVRVYSNISPANGEGPMNWNDIQPKYVNPHGNRNVNSVDYRITVQFGDGHQETIYLYYRYPSGCTPPRP